MIKLSVEKIAEITSRHNEPADWTSAEPFYKGMFWSQTGGILESDEYIREWTYKTRHQNLLVIDLPRELRRTDFKAAKEKHAALADKIAKLEAALDGTEFTFQDERDYFEGGLRKDNETVRAIWVHTALFEDSIPASDDKLASLAKVAYRLDVAARLQIPGIVASYKRGYGGYGDNYSLHSSDDGYHLLSRQQELVLKETETSIETQSQRLDVAETPSLYSKLLCGLIDPMFSFAKSRVDYSQNPAALPAAVVADMVAHDETSVIIELGDGKEFVLTNLTKAISLRELAQGMHGIIDNCHQISVVRAMPLPRPRHRFYIVGGKIVTDSPVSHDCSIGDVSIVKYVNKDGPAAKTISFRPDEDDIRTMRNFCEESVFRICQFRPNWIVDIELAGGVPYLVAVEELFDGEWFGGVEPLLLDAIAVQQKGSFSEEELRLSGFGFSSGPKPRRSAQKTQRLVYGQETVATQDKIADLLKSLTSEDDISNQEQED